MSGEPSTAALQMKRINLRRSLPSEICVDKASSLTVIAGVAYEFGDYVSDFPLTPLLLIRNVGGASGAMEVAAVAPWQEVKGLSVRKSGIYHKITFSIASYVSVGLRIQVKIGSASASVLTDASSASSVWTPTYAEFVLPFISDYIEITAPDTTGAMPSLTNFREAIVPLWLCETASGDASLQAMPHTQTRLLIQEDYGATIGSHIWDSSLILCEYLHSVLGASGTSVAEGQAGTDTDERQQAKVRVCLELGAGCGVVGLFLAQALQRRAAIVGENASTGGGTSTEGYPRARALVFLTDTAQQMRYLERNLLLNAPADADADVAARQSQFRCVPLELDWAQIPPVMDGDSLRSCRFRRLIRETYADFIGSPFPLDAPYAVKSVSDPSSAPPVPESEPPSAPTPAPNPVVDIIVAADVLYDQTAIDALFRTVRWFATPAQTQVYIAQKLRSAQKLVDVSIIPGFSASLVHQECSVLVYKLVAL